MSTPLALLELNGSTLSLRVRPAFLSHLFGILPLVVTPHEVEAIYPSRRLRYRAIGIRPRGQPPAYFLTVGNDPAAILARVNDAGFPVSWEERLFSYA